MFEPGSRGHDMGKDAVKSVELHPQFDCGFVNAAELSVD